MGASEYLSSAALAQLSQAEIERYVDSLVRRGLDDGPEWDRTYRWLDKNGYL